MTGILDFIYPPTCLICGITLPDEENSIFLDDQRGEVSDRILLCEECRRQIIVDSKDQCPRCSGSRRFMGGEAKDCGSCHSQHFKFKKVIALGAYESPLSERILRMKHESPPILAAHLTRLLIQTRKDSFLALNSELIIPVPMHYLRRFFRGVNDSEEIAEEIGRFLKIPVLRKVLFRSRRTLRQATLPGWMRFENVRGAFKLNPRFSWIGQNAKQMIAGKRVLLVDDVLTTGATCNEITQLLLQEGAASVSIAVLARAEGARPRHPFKKPLKKKRWHKRK